jgi:metallo-beta-lactamase family protein
MGRDAMQTSLTFHGAARTVTGSCMELAVDKTRLLIDCGLFQGSRGLETLNHQPLGFAARAIDGLLLTHAHIDHCGLIPRLVKEGFAGPIWCTAPTADLLAYTLPDSGRIQESEAERQSLRNERRGLDPVQPLYTEADAKRALDQIRTLKLETWTQVGEQVKVRYWNAGHILGSASIEVLAGGLHLLFSGDIGPDEKAFYPDPDAPDGFDVVVTESTYGDRDKPDATLEQRRAILEQEVEAALARGGNLIIPAFAIERTQELLFDLAVLMNSGRLKRTQVFVDSPLAHGATRIFARHSHELEGLDGQSVFDHPSFHYVESVEHSRQLNSMQGAIILAASGMCEAGRIRHHLKHNLWRSQATVLFVGYQAAGTLGRVIMDGAKRVRISGDEIAVRAHIRRIEGYSAHADQTELVNWMRERLPVRSGVFLTHGEAPAMAKLSQLLIGLGLPAGKVICPALGERYALAPAEAPRLISQARAEAEVVERDWQNDYAEVALDLKSKLKALPSEQARREALARMKAVLESLPR